MLTEINIARFASIKQPMRIELGKTTLIQGHGAVGKTAICDAIACLFDYRAAFTASKARFSGDHVILRATCADAQGTKHDVLREIERRKQSIISDRLVLDEVETNHHESLSAILKVIYIRDSMRRTVKTGKEVAKFCIETLIGQPRAPRGPLRKSLRALERAVNTQPDSLVEELRWQADGVLRTKNWHQDFWLNYGGFSGGERYQVLIELALALARMSTRFRPVMVIMDNVYVRDYEALARRMDSCTEPNLQFVLTTWQEGLESALHPDCFIKLGVENRESFVKETRFMTPEPVLRAELAIASFGSGHEDEFINTVVVPLLRNMGFGPVERIQHHGPGELGLDIGPFTGAGFEWRKAFCGAQVKCVKLNAKSGSKNNIQHLIDQVNKALNNRFFDEATARDSGLDYVLVFLSKHPTPEAIKTFNSRFEGDRRVIVLTPRKIAELVVKYGVSWSQT
jgi:hypothetical protein